MVTIITSPGAFTAIVSESEKGTFAKVFAPKADWGCGLYWSEELARKNFG